MEEQFQKVLPLTKRHKDVMKLHLAAAQQMELRARTSLFLLNHFEEIIAGNVLKGTEQKTAIALLKENQKAKKAFTAEYLTFWKPTRTHECAEWLFDSILEALSALCGKTF